MVRFARSLPARYGVAAAAVAGALGIGLLGYPSLAPDADLLFLPAVAVSAWFGGFGPGLFAAVLGGFAGHYYLVAPRFSWLPLDSMAVSRAVAHVVVGAFVAALIERRHAASAHLAAVVASTADGVITTSLDGLVTGWNAGASRLFGRDGAAVLGRRLAEVGIEPAIAQLLLARVRAGAAVQDVELIIARPAGGGAAAPAGDSPDAGTIDVALTASPVRNAGGRVTGASFIARDVTARRAAERELIRRESEFEALAENAPDIVARFDPALRCVYVNPAFELLAGVPRAALPDALAALLRRPAHARHVERLTTLMRGVLASGDAASYDAVFETALGARRMHVRLSPEAGGEQVVASVLLVARDLTELVRAEQEAQRAADENQRLYEGARRLSASLEPAQVFHALREIVMEALPCDGLIVSSYAAEDRMITCRHAWVEGEFVDPAKFPPVRLNPDGHGMQSRVITTGEALVIDDVDAQTRQPGTRYYYVDPDGTVHNAPTEARHTRSAVMVPLRREDEVVGVLQVMANRLAAFTPHDAQFLEALAAHMAAAEHNARLYEQARSELEQRRAVEAELRESEQRFRELAATLEQRVSERTAQLRESHDQMVHFSYTISHDLRAPVRAIRGWLDALVEDFGTGMPEQGRRYAARVAEATDRMDRLIRELLAYSRLGRVELAHAHVSLTGCAREALAMLRTEPGGPHVEVDDRLGDAPLEVMAHRPALVQVIWNLLHNAAKFVAPGVTPHITLRTEANEGRVRLWIQDNGIGIAPEHQQRIFGVFERLHHDHAYAGSGIGLAMVRRAMERMGGTVGVESEAGVGSRFWIELPGAAVAAPARDTAAIAG